MSKKIKFGLPVFYLIGIIFAVIGAVFLVIGTPLFMMSGQYTGEKQESFFMIGIIFSAMGGFFFLTGLIFIGIELSKRRRIKKLIKNNNYVYGTICDVGCNYNVEVNGIHPYIVNVQYRDEFGVIHIFKSRNLMFNPENMFMNENVKIYVDKNKFKHYYVDIDSVLPEVKWH